jgi:hypothetical protein
MVPPDECLGVLVRHPPFETPTVGAATHSHTLGARGQVEDESLAVVSDDVPPKRRADSPAIHAPYLDGITSAHHGDRRLDAFATDQTDGLIREEAAWRDSLGLFAASDGNARDPSLARHVPVMFACGVARFL